MYLRILLLHQQEENYVNYAFWLYIEHIRFKTIVFSIVDPKGNSDFLLKNSEGLTVKSGAVQPTNQSVSESRRYEQIILRPSWPYCFNDVNTPILDPHPQTDKLAFISCIEYQSLFLRNRGAEVCSYDT